MSSTLNRIGNFSVVSKIYTTKINFVGVLDTFFFWLGGEVSRGRVPKL